MIATLLMLWACAPEPEPRCREGFARAGDGHCYPARIESDPTLIDVLGLPECERARSGTLISLEAGCASGLCAGDLFADAVAVLGDRPTCVTSGADRFCSWPKGVEGRWRDTDGDGVPDADAGNQRVRVLSHYGGSTTDGLAPGISMACFVDALGDAEETLVVDTPAGLQLRSLFWERFGLLVIDSRDALARTGYDGVADDLYLYGPP